jgi:hypothetical protein
MQCVFVHSFRKVKVIMTCRRVGVLKRYIQTEIGAYLYVGDHLHLIIKYLHSFYSE